MSRHNSDIDPQTPSDSAWLRHLRLRANHRYSELPALLSQLSPTAQAGDSPTGRINDTEMTKDELLLRYNLLASRISSFFSHEKHLHQASFAKPHELRPLLSPSVDGSHLLLGKGMNNHVLRVQRTKKSPELGNMFACGPTGCGKSSFMISQLLTWPHSAMVNDIKGELFAKTAGLRAKWGKVFVVDSRGLGNRFDPLDGRETEDKLYAMAKQLLYEPKEKDPAFTQRAIKMLTQIFLAARVENRLAGFEKYHLLPYVRPLLRLELQDVARRIHAVSPELAIPFLDAKIGNKAVDENKFLANSWEGLTARLYPLLTDHVIRCFNGSDVTIEDILYSKEPITVYLRWPEADLLALSPLIRLVWDSLINGLITGYDNVGGKNCQPSLVVIDEAGRTEIPNLYHYISTVRSRRISMLLAFQSKSQLEATYGKARAEDIRNNCETQIWFPPASIETADYLQHCLGDVSGFASSETDHHGAKSHSSSEREVPLMTAQQIKQMNDYILAWHRGLPPIKTKSIKWYQFPLLEQRQAIAPPPLRPLPPVGGRRVPPRTGTFKNRGLVLLAL